MLHASRNLLLIALVLPAASALACYRQTSPAGAYSFAFFDWYNQTHPIAREIDELRGMLDVGHDEAEARSRIEAITLWQAQLNARLRAAEPPARWRFYHERIGEYLEEFDLRAAEIRESLTWEILSVLIDRLEADHLQLRQRVVTCYAQSPSCAPAGAPASVPSALREHGQGTVLPCPGAWEDGRLTPPAEDRSLLAAG